MNFNKVKFLSLLILFAYIAIGVFGLFPAVHATEMPMPNCPYAEGGFSVCSNSFEHITNWQQFSNTIFPSLFALLLILGIVLYFTSKNQLDLKQYFYRWKYYLYREKLSRAPNKIIKWLSLFENSPSLA